MKIAQTISIPLSPIKKAFITIYNDPTGCNSQIFETEIFINPGLLEPDNFIKWIEEVRQKFREAYGAMAGEDFRDINVAFDYEIEQSSPEEQKITFHD